MMLRGNEDNGEDRDFVRTKEWNNVRAIDPRDLRPDPNVPICSPQAGNFIGHKDYQNVLWYKEREIADKNGPFFNIEKARGLVGGGRDGRSSGGRWMDGDYLDGRLAEYPNLPVVHLQWKIIPKDWGLSENKNA